MIAVELPAATTLTATHTPGTALERLRPVGGSRLLMPVLVGIFAILAIAGLHYANSLLVPIAVSVFLTLLLGPLVRWTGKVGVAEPVGAGIILFGVMLIVGVTILALAVPAAEWLRRAPDTLRQAQVKLQNVAPLKTIQETAASVAQVTAGATSDTAATPVKVATASPLQRMSWTTANMVGGVLTVVVLTYFLLASASMFRRKIAYLFPSGQQRTRIKRALFEVEEQMSRYLLITTSISLTVGTATWAFLAIIGMPNPLLWGAMAALLNFIPYLGALVTIVLIGIVALASFPGMEQVLLACGGFLAINLMESNFLTPVVLGRKMPLNTVAIFLSLLFWGWVWGLAGIIMAVPITVMIQVISAHSERFRGLAILLGNWGSQSTRVNPGLARVRTSS